MFKASHIMSWPDGLYSIASLLWGLWLSATHTISIKSGWGLELGWVIATFWIFSFSYILLDICCLLGIIVLLRAPIRAKLLQADRWLCILHFHFSILRNVWLTQYLEVANFLWLQNKNQIITTPPNVAVSIAAKNLHFFACPHPTFAGPKI